MKKLFLFVAIMCFGFFSKAINSPDYDVGKEVVNVIDNDVIVASVDLNTLETSVFVSEYKVESYYLTAGKHHYFVGIKTIKEDADCEYLYYSQKRSKEKLKLRKKVVRQYLVLSHHLKNSSGGLPYNCLLKRRESEQSFPT